MNLYPAIDLKDGACVRRLFNAKFDAKFKVEGSPCVATVQPGALAPYEGSESGSTEALDAAGISGRTTFVGLKKAAAGGHDLSKAETRRLESALPTTFNRLMALPSWRRRTILFCERKKAARGKPECIGEYMRIWARG